MCVPTCCTEIVSVFITCCNMSLSCLPIIILVPFDNQSVNIFEKIEFINLNTVYSDFFTPFSQVPVPF